MEKREEFVDESGPPKGGKSGRIGRLDDQTMGYYRRVSDTLKEEFESPEDKELMLDNVFKQLCEEALRVSCNQTVSGIVESLLHEATRKQLVMFMNTFASDWETACQDRFAGYVTQTLLHKLMPYFGKDLDSEEEQQGLKSPKTRLLELYSFLMGNLALFMQDTYASHVLRVLMETLAGSEVSEDVIRSKVARRKDQKHSTESNQQPTSYNPPEEFKELLHTMARKLFSMKKLKDHVTNHLSNPVMQTMLLLLQRTSPALCAEMCQLLINNTDMFEPGTNNSLPPLLSHSVGSHLIDQLVVVAPTALYTSILEHHLQGQLLELARDPIANYVLQRFIHQAHSVTQFESIFAELYNHLEDIMAHNNFGVITKLTEGCLKFGTKQKKFIKYIMKAFHCYKPVEYQVKVVTLLASLMAYDHYYKVKDTNDKDLDESGDKNEDNTKDDKNVIAESDRTQLKEVNYHGSVILQNLLQFGNPEAIVTSILDMEPTELTTLACHKFGSHVIDAFLKSTTAGEKSRALLYNKLKGCYMDIACHRIGSRVLDTFSAQASMKQKFLIVEELSKKEQKLRSNQFGVFVWRNLAVGHYIRRPEDWKDIQRGNIKKRKMFQDIIADQAKQGASAKKKKFQVNKEDSSTLLKDSDDDADKATNAIDDIFSSKRERKHARNPTEPDETNTASEKKRKQDKHAPPSGDFCEVNEESKSEGKKKKKISASDKKRKQDKHAPPSGDFCEVNEESKSEGKKKKKKLKTV